MDSGQSKAGEPANTKGEDAGSGDYLTGADRVKGNMAHDTIPTRKRPRDRRSGSNFIFRVLFM